MLVTAELQAPDINPIDLLCDVVELEICSMNVQLTYLQQTRSRISR